MQKLWIFTVIVLVLIGCNKKEPQLITSEPASDPNMEAPADLTLESEESKPLIEIGPDDVLKIMVRHDGAPGMYLGEDGEVHGFYVDLDRLVMEEMGQRYEFIAYDDLGPAIQNIKTGIYHSALSVPDLPNYHGLVNLSIPYERLHYVTFVQDDNQDIRGETKEDIIESLYGKKVGVQIQGHIYQELIQFREIELLEYSTTTAALELLDSGELDAVPDVERIGRHYSRLNGWNIKPVGEPIISHLITTGFSKVVDPAVVQRYNTALAVILEDGRYEALYESYFGELQDRDRP